ncbi:MAG: orotidine-5'-phosphate decarboxylase [Spirochaetaceae bacterium]|nr:orotidine-5'-phosphate decarboxylase [Spirochaetaceae bacterium]
MNSATESSSQAAPAPAAECAGPEESRRLDWLIVGLDVPDLEQARPLVRALADRVGALKIGPVLHTRAGAAAIDLVHEHGGRVFLDLKWHDIPNTVADACRSAAEQGVWMVNVHAVGGERMLAAARDALEQARPRGVARPLLIAVTVLTSLDDADLPATGVTGSVAAQVNRLAALAERGGADGLVTSGHEVAALHARWPRFNLVVPGVRPRWLTAGGTAPADDQRRVASPAATLAAGASHVVIARPVITHADPAQAVRLTAEEVAAES